MVCCLEIQNPETTIIHNTRQQHQPLRTTMDFVAFFNNLQDVSISDSSESNIMIMIVTLLVQLINLSEGKCHHSFSNLYTKWKLSLTLFMLMDYDFLGVCSFRICPSRRSSVYPGPPPYIWPCGHYVWNVHFACCGNKTSPLPRVSGKACPFALKTAHIIA